MLSLLTMYYHPPQTIEESYSMSGSFRIYKHMWLEKELSDFELHGLCGVIVHNRPFDQPLKAEHFVKPILEMRFELNIIPQEPIIKLGKKEHIDAFFESGKLQLGSYAYYNTFEHPEIGDNQEGIVTLLAKTDFGIIGGKYGSGFNQYMFCASIGSPDCETMKKFGYDSGFIINDPIGFANAIAESICAASSTFGRCVYHPHKAILGFPNDIVDRNKLSHESGKIVNAAQHFIKSERYSHQKEFIFLWEMQSDLSGSKVIDCSSARQYCSPLSLSDIN